MLFHSWLLSPSAGPEQVQGCLPLPEAVLSEGSGNSVTLWRSRWAAGGLQAADCQGGKEVFALETWAQLLPCPEAALNGTVQFSSVTQSCPTLYDPMNCSMPGLPVHHQLLESTETHVHCVSDATQPSHPLSSPSPPAFNLSQHQDLFK